MGRIGEGETSSGTGPECCMCGDHGLSSELFTCKNCGFRSQHNNLYPRAESYHICNWCLSQKDEKKGEDLETSKSSQNLSHKTTSDHQHTIKIKKSKRDDDHSVDRIKTIDHNQIKKQINKPPPPSKRVVINSERTIIKRSRSESNAGLIVKPVFRNKVRRYKLLDEVSS
ncbi:hypothetical protein C2S51_013721 [Perilla frutescens var. frutescens]|nr:hypothetical protein C2S51_013721 [Perilla frutescens var. frutescens]